MHQHSVIQKTIPDEGEEQTITSFPECRPTDLFDYQGYV